MDQLGRVSQTTTFFNSGWLWLGPTPPKEQDRARTNSSMHRRRNEIDNRLRPEAEDAAEDGVEDVLLRLGVPGEETDRSEAETHDRQYGQNSSRELALEAPK